MLVQICIEHVGEPIAFSLCPATQYPKDADERVPIYQDEARVRSGGEGSGPVLFAATITNETGGLQSALESCSRFIRDNNHKKYGDCSWRVQPVLAQKIR